MDSGRERPEEPPSPFRARPPRSNGQLQSCPRSFVMTAYRHMAINEVDDVAVVHFRNRRIVEDLNIQELGQELFQLIETDQRKKLVLNFSSVDFLSSAALGKLITLDKKVKAH